MYKYRYPNKGWIDTDGYRRISVNGKSIDEHKYIWVRHNQMPIPKGCCIHHINGNPLNNDIKNLILLPRGYHSSLHREIEKRRRLRI